MMFISHIFLVLLLLVFLPGYKSTACQCPNKWVTFQGSCYLFGRKAIHFTQAENYCKQRNATLVQINTMAENAFLKDYIFRLMGDRFWIGLTDDEREGQWKWLDAHTPPTFKDWAPNEPNSWAPVDDCAAMAKDDPYHGRWIDEACNMNYLPICEKSMF